MVKPMDHQEFNATLTELGLKKHVDLIRLLDSLTGEKIWPTTVSNWSKENKSNPPVGIVAFLRAALRLYRKTGMVVIPEDGVGIEIERPKPVDTSQLLLRLARLIDAQGSDLERVNRVLSILESEGTSKPNV